MILVYHPGVTTIAESPFWSDDDPGVTTALGSPPPWGQRPDITTNLESLWFWSDHGPGDTTIPQGTAPPLRPPSPLWGQPGPAVWGPPAPSAASAARSPRPPWRPLSAPTAAPPRPLPPRGGAGPPGSYQSRRDRGMTPRCPVRGFTEVCVCGETSPPARSPGPRDSRCRRPGAARAGRGGGAGPPAGGACRKV